MPTRKLQVKQETRVDKVASRKASGRSKSTELSVRGRAKDVGDASQVPNLSGSQSRWESTPRKSARTAWVVGGMPGPDAVTVAVAAAGPAGAMLPMEKLNGTWPLATAFFIKASAVWASTRPMPPSTR